MTARPIAATQQAATSVLAPLASGSPAISAPALTSMSAPRGLTTVSKSATTLKGATNVYVKTATLSSTLGTVFRPMKAKPFVQTAVAVRAAGLCKIPPPTPWSLCASATLATTLTRQTTRRAWTTTSVKTVCALRRVTTQRAASPVPVTAASSSSPISGRALRAPVYSTAPSVS